MIDILRGRFTIRGEFFVISGFIIITCLFLLYTKYQDPSQLVPQSIDSIQRFAFMFYVVFLAAFGLIGLGMYKFHKEKNNTLGLFGKIATLTWNDKSRKIFVSCIFIYGVFFSFLSGTLVYQPELVFSYHYGVNIPSVELIPCCDTVGYMPLILIYLTEHVGLQIIPINLLLQIIVSYLVALNVSLVFAANSISKKRRSIGSIGAATGLFIACPTCAGSAVSLILGPIAGITASIVLGQLQTLFIAISIPILLYSPFFLVRRISRLSDECN